MRVEIPIEIMNDDFSSYMENFTKIEEWIDLTKSKESGENKVSPKKKPNPNFPEDLPIYSD